MKKLILSFSVLFGLTLSLSAQTKQAKADKIKQKSITTEVNKEKIKKDTEKAQELPKFQLTSEPFIGSKTEFLKIQKAKAKN